MNTATKTPRSSQRRLSEQEKQAIVAAVATGQTQTAVAQHFNVNLNTVCRLVNNVRRMVQNPPKGLTLDWRRKLADELPSKAVNTLELAIDDRNDIHKAATSAVAVLKGTGALQGDGVTVNVQQIIAAIPDELRWRYVTSDDVDPTPTGSGSE